MKFTVPIKIDAENEEAALRVRNMIEQEIGAAFELDSQDIKGVETAHTGDLELEEDPHDKPAIEAARTKRGQEGEIEIDDNAKVSYSADGGAYVAAWVWVNDNEIADAGDSNPETGAGMEEAVESEGGHCD